MIGRSLPHVRGVRPAHALPLPCCPGLEQPQVADSVAAGQVKSDTRQSLAKSGAQAVVQLASSGDNDGTTG